MKYLLYIGVTILLSIVISAIVVIIISKADTSPTQDPKCRGGHDF